VHLGVEDGEVLGVEVEDGACEADFACVAAAEVGAAEHCFAAEDGADAEAVEPADEGAGVGGVEEDRVGVGGGRIRRFARLSGGVR